jgi:predicted TIM-barrel fold metal-dependent hydrolase
LDAQYRGLINHRCTSGESSLGVAGAVRGIKLYPPLGYSPDNPVLEPIWQYADTNRLPVISHCMSKGGVLNTNKDGGLGLEDKSELRNYTAPSSYGNVLRAHRNMRLCLAHFGGNKEWDKYLERHNGGIGSISTHPLEYFKEDPFKEQDWVNQIVEMLVSGKFPNLYVDTSYTFFEEKYREPLRDLLEQYPSIRSQVLFGSDFYLSVQVKPNEEKFPEEKFPGVLEGAITKALFDQIAVTNPGQFL